VYVARNGYQKCEALGKEGGILGRGTHRHQQLGVLLANYLQRTLDPNAHSIGRIGTTKMGHSLVSI
jgi:hypothetical protein